MDRRSFVELSPVYPLPQVRRSPRRIPWLPWERWETRRRSIISVGRDQNQVNVAKLVHGMIKEHLALLADIEKGGMRG